MDAGERRSVIDLVDETLIVAAPARVREALCGERFWETAFPGVRLTCIDDRGPLGKRWTVAGSLHGSAEVWLERWTDAVIVHVYWQVDPASDVRGRAAERTARHHALAVKRHVREVKDALEGDRAPGTPRVGGSH